MYIVRSKIRNLAKSQGKRVSKGYIMYLERKVHEIVSGHIKMLGSRMTLNVSDAEALEAYRSTRP